MSKPRGKHAACIYPGIDAWLRSHHLNLSILSKLIGFTYAHTYNVANGRTCPSKQFIDKLMQATGMTYEEAFGDPRKESENT